MFFYKSNGNRFLSSLDWFPILVYLNGSFYLYIIDTPYRIYFYTLHTRPYLSYILRFPVKGVKGGSIFVLLAWPKSTKKSRLRLLSYSVSSFRCARRKLAALRQRRSGRFTPFLRLTLTRTRPVQLTIENWRLTIFFFSLIYPWNLPCDCRGVALLRLKTMFCTTK